MLEEARISDVHIHASEGCLIVPVQADLCDESLSQLQTNLLGQIEETGAHGVVVDVSTVTVIDGFMSDAFARMAQTARLLGADMVITGVRPSVAATLADFDIAVADMRWAGTLDEGLRMLRVVAGKRGCAAIDASDGLFRNTE